MGEFNQSITSSHQSTSQSWLSLINGAKYSLRISAPYFTLNDTEGATGPWEEWGHEVGMEIYNALIAASQRGVDIQVVENTPGSTDSLRLQQQGVISLRLIDVGSLLGSGILHTKFIIVD